MNGEEDERERTRTRRVETEHDRDEHGAAWESLGRGGCSRLRREEAYQLYVQWTVKKETPLAMFYKVRLNLEDTSAMTPT